MMPRLKSSPLVLALTACATLAACGAPPDPATPVVTVASTPTPSAAPAPPAAPTSGPRDPKIVALATAVLATCKFEDDAFDSECPALKPWEEEEEAFADGKGDATLFSMLGDGDLKIRRLAAEKDISSAFWEDKAHAVALASLAKDEKDGSVQAALGHRVTEVDWQTLGLADTLKDLAQHAPTPVRRAIGIQALQHFATPASVEAVRILVEDADQHVADATVEELWHGDKQPAVCDLMTKLMGSGDFRQSTAILSAANARNCAGMKDRVVAELTKRLAEPSKVDREHNRGWDYVRAARYICRDAAPTDKRQGLDLLKKLAAPAIADKATRVNALRYYAECDPKTGPAFVGGFVRDKVIGKDAKEIVDGLAAKKKEVRR